MDGVERTRHEVREVFDGVPKNERTGVVRLAAVVHAHHVEPGAHVADGRAAGTAEQVQQTRAAHRSHGPPASTRRTVSPVSARR